MTTHPASLEELTRDYLELLLTGQRHEATRRVLDVAESGTHVRDIYLQVFQPAQYELGRLWQENEISVADEHYCTAATQLTMSLLYPFLFNPDREARIPEPIVVSAIAGELHELGARMVADILESEAWNTRFLGADTPTEALLRTVSERRVPLVSISVTLSKHVLVAADLIESLRSEPGGASLKVIVGGAAFVAEQTLWRDVGADATAPDALSAARLVEQLLGSATP